MPVNPDCVTDVVLVAYHRYLLAAASANTGQPHFNDAGLNSVIIAAARYLQQVLCFIPAVISTGAKMPEPICYVFIHGDWR